MGKIRLADLAEALGLSTATVSYVLNGKQGKVSEQTRARVLELVEKTGYLPKRAEVLMGMNPSRLIGLTVNDHPEYEGKPLENPYYAKFISCLQKECAAAGCDLLIRTVSTWNQAAEFASVWNMKGLVVAGFCDADYLSLKSRIHIPMAAIDSTDAMEGVASICVDDELGGRLVGTYLQQQGYEEVLVLTTNLECNDKSRIDGLKSTGIKSRVLMIHPDSASRRKQLLDYDFSDVKAVFCVSDMQAIELMSIFYERGIRVPEDISVIGFDGIEAGKTSCPPLTTVSQDLQEKARLAIESLDQEPSHRLSSVSLTIRRSVGHA